MSSRSKQAISCLCRLAAAGALTGLLAGCVSTQAVTPKAAPVGKLVKLAFYSDVTPACAPNGKVAVRVVREPSSGRLEFREAHDFRPYTLACNMTRVNGVQVWYRGAARVADTAVVEVHFPTRNVRVETFEIAVR